MRFIQSPYHSSRQGQKIDVVVIHTMVGSFSGTINYFQNNANTVSAHYLVDLNGDIVQMVDEDRAAHHAGIVDRPSAKLVKERLNPNTYSIGIENADNSDPAGADRQNQYPNLIGLVLDICKRNNIPVDRDHIIGHREIRASKTCPGNLDVDYIVAEVKKRIGQSQGGANMSTDQFYQKFLEAYRKHKDDISWGDDKNKPEGALLEDSAMIGRMLDEVARDRSALVERIKVLENQANSDDDKISSVVDSLLKSFNPTDWEIDGASVSQNSYGDNEIRYNFKKKG